MIFVNFIFQQNKFQTNYNIMYNSSMLRIKESGQQMQRKTGVTESEYCRKKMAQHAIQFGSNYEFEHRVLHTRALSLGEEVKLKNS